MKVDFKNSNIYLGIKSEKYFKFAKIFWKIFLFLSLIFFLIFLICFFENTFSVFSLKILLSFSLFFLIFSISFLIFTLFFEEELKNPKPLLTLDDLISNISSLNIIDFLDFDLSKAFYKAFLFSKKRKIVLDSSVLLYFILKEIKDLDFIFLRNLIDPKYLKEALEDNLKAEKREKFYLADQLEKVFLEAGKIAKEKSHSKIKAGDVILSLVSFNKFFQKILIEKDLKKEDLENTLDWKERIEKEIEKRKKIFEYENLLKKGSIGREFSAGYTITLDRYSIDWTEIAKKRGEINIIGHNKELERVERILTKLRINNVLIVGESGVGRKTLVEKLAQKITFGKSLPSLNYKRVVELNLPSLLTEVKSSEEVEFILEKIFEEVVFSSNVILVIDEIHNFIGIKEWRPGAIDISGVLSRFLHLPNFQIIGITTYEGLHKNIEQNPAVLSLFEKVELSPLSKKETLMVMENLVLELEQKYKIFIPYFVLNKVYEYCERYIGDVPFPKKAVDSLDEISAFVARFKKDKIVTLQDVAKVFSQKTEIPIGSLEREEKEKLLKLEELIHQRIINQEEAVREIASALRRARTQVTIRKGPMGAFLFLGPTGVGKTETAKTLCKIYFGDQSKMIRLDMSEFQNIEDIKRLIGGPGEEGLLTTRVREEPFSLVLLDEFEKAHYNILNLFLQILDEGYVRDGQGRVVDFKNTIIIATSNAGYKIILKALEKDVPFGEVKKELLDYLFKEGIFRPELINRFDEVIIFKSLTKENLLDIAQLLLSDLKENLKKKEIEFEITEDLKEKIVELGYNEIFGAREMRRVIQDKVEDPISEAILKEEIKKGDKIKVDPKTFEVVKIT